MMNGNDLATISETSLEMLIAYTLLGYLITCYSLHDVGIGISQGIICENRTRKVLTQIAIS